MIIHISLTSPVLHVNYIVPFLGESITIVNTVSVADKSCVASACVMRKSVHRLLWQLMHTQLKKAATACLKACYMEA